MNDAAVTRLGQQYDVVVVGGGPAGLAAAVTLARARRQLLVVDAGRPRNAPADGVHGFLSRDGVPPADLLAAGRDEVRRYGGEVLDGEVVSVRRVAPEADEAGEDPAADDRTGFEVLLAGGRSFQARRLLVATGLTDELPDVPGLAERWGRDVLHCPYCHGWEVRDRAVGVLGTGPAAVEQALLWRQWTATVTLFLHTGGEPDDEQWEALAARGVQVVDGEVVGLEVRDDRLVGVRLRGGTVVPAEVLVVATRLRARGDVTAALGLHPEPALHGPREVGTRLPAGPAGATDVPGVRVAGNATDPFAQVVVAAADGVRAAAGINADLVAEDSRTALAVRRGAGQGTVPAQLSFSAAAEREVFDRVVAPRTRHGLGT